MFEWDWHQNGWKSDSHFILNSLTCIFIIEPPHTVSVKFGIEAGVGWQENAFVSSKTNKKQPPKAPRQCLVTKAVDSFQIVDLTAHIFLKFNQDVEDSSNPSVKLLAELFFVGQDMTFWLQEMPPVC